MKDIEIIENLDKEKSIFYASPNDYIRIVMYKNNDEYVIKNYHTEDICLKTSNTTDMLQRFNEIKKDFDLALVPELEES